MFSFDVCKKIVYALEQAASARWYRGEAVSDGLTEALDKAMAALRVALKEAANAE